MCRREGRLKPRPASPANMSKRGLRARLYAPNQTLIMVNAPLPAEDFGDGKMRAAIPAGDRPARKGDPIDLGRNPFFGAIRQMRRNADRGTAAWDISRNYRPRADLCKITNADVSEDCCPTAKQNASADPRGSVRASDFPSDGDVLHDRHLIADRDKSAHHDTGAMIQEYRCSDRSGRMDADLE